MSVDITSSGGQFSPFSYISVLSLADNILGAKKEKKTISLTTQYFFFLNALFLVEHLTPTSSESDNLI